MPPYRDRTRGQASEAQEEQLDWLNEIHEDLLELVKLQRQQTEQLRAIRMHSGLIHALAIIWIILTVLGIVFWALSR